MSGTGVKHDSGKVRVDLLSFEAMEEIAKVMTFGAGKYGDDNWRGGMAWRRLLGAGLRHLFAFSRGENLDPESGLPHLAHAGCCIMFLLEYYLTANGKDDRYVRVPKQVEVTGTSESSHYVILDKWQNQG